MVTQWTGSPRISTEGISDDGIAAASGFCGASMPSIAQDDTDPGSHGKFRTLILP